VITMSTLSAKKTRFYITVLLIFLLSLRQLVENVGKATCGKSMRNY
jgi:hypothetical protein